MSMKGSISGGNSAIGSAITKNPKNVFHGTTDGHWKRGFSAYEVAVAEGFVGSKSEWLASLKGESVSIASIVDDGESITITFSDGNTAVVRHGSPIDFRVDSDNKLYWKYANTNTWNELIDIQSIIDTTLTTRMSNYAKIYYNTTANWNSQRDLTSELCTFYVYTDYTTTQDEQGNAIQKPAIKIGDGQAFLIDLPFIGSDLSELIAKIEDHINNHAIHVSETDRIFWDNKCSVDESELSEENLIFTIE